MRVHTKPLSPTISRGTTTALKKQKNSNPPSGFYGLFKARHPHVTSKNERQITVHVL